MVMVFIGENMVCCVLRKGRVLEAMSEKKKVVSRKVGKNMRVKLRNCTTLVSQITFL